MIIAAQQIQNELDAKGFKQVTCDDRSYFLPSIKWVYQLQQWHLKRPWKYEAEKSDCEDAAISSRDDARKAAQNGDIPDGCGFAFGIIKVGVSFMNTIMLDGGGTHAANIVRTVQGEWLYYDRQTSIVKPLQNCLDDGDIIRLDSVCI